MAWFLVAYKTPTSGPRAGMPNTRVLAIDDYTPLIVADGGAWDATEVLGDQAIAKVRASEETLTAIASDPLCVRLPFDTLDIPLSSVPVVARQRILSRLATAGYPVQKISEKVGDLSGVTAKDVLEFFASQRRKPRFDAGTKKILFDGPVLPCRSLRSVDMKVQ